MKKRVLVIDDAATVREYHCSILKEAGFETEEAVNGLEALEKALKNPFDLYIVDINMPKMDGYSFLKELRTQKIPQVPAIMVSTEAEEKDRESAFKAGANLYLVKPVTPEILLRYVKILLGEV